MSRVGVVRIDWIFLKDVRAYCLCATFLSISSQRCVRVRELRARKICHAKVCKQIWHVMNFDWFCIVRRALWLVGSKYERVSRKSVSIKKWKNRHFPSFVELSLRNIFYTHTCFWWWCLWSTVMTFISKFWCTVKLEHHRNRHENILIHIKWFVHSACHGVCRESTPLVNEMSI